MLPELARVFSVGLGQAAQVVSLFAVVYGLSQLFYGPLGDRLGKLRVISVATLGCSLGNLAALFVTSLDALVLARMAVALGAAAIIPLSLAWIGDSVEYDRLQETLARVGLEGLQHLLKQAELHLPVREALLAFSRCLA